MTYVVMARVCQVYKLMRSSLKLTSSTKIGKEELRKLKIIINCLYESNDSFDFREPVDWKGMGLTDYTSIIKHPMDLSTVLKRLKEERTTKVEEVLDDLQLIWDNCKTYNPDNSWIHSIAEKLERAFKKMLKNYFPEMNVPVPISIRSITQSHQRRRVHMALPIYSTRITRILRTSRSSNSVRNCLSSPPTSWPKSSMK